jgi:DNA-binding XRE family transcriptional regulator
MSDVRISPAGDGFYARAKKDQETDETPHACYDGWVYLGFDTEGGNGEPVQVVDKVPCKRCRSWWCSLSVVDGQKVRRLRDEAFFDQKDLAKMAGISTHTLMRTEKGYTPHSTRATIRKIAKALGVEPIELTIREEDLKSWL